MARVGESIQEQSFGDSLSARCTLVVSEQRDMDD